MIGSIDNNFSELRIVTNFLLKRGYHGRNFINSYWKKIKLRYYAQLIAVKLLLFHWFIASIHHGKIPVFHIGIVSGEEGMPSHSTWRRASAAL
ncbi:hypothetical protein C9I90_14500 [Photobacterium aphoticum]|uniref:Uncharacterized protein n=1 Tax=Photobacterium aphoticum TaxID=754436 RepID=A0A0J1GIA1_9GAMM|nr:hypothetical protein ABT58_17500 [Photobacterium aphoticum]PSU55937.1 hypothetical protein C9I90_14500 [Photobacterium aphoticum]